MRLQKQTSRKMENGVGYVKWVIVIPPHVINTLGWDEGITLEIEAKENKLLLKPRLNNK